MKSYGHILTLGDKLLITGIVSCALLGLFILPVLRSQGTQAIVEAEDGSGLILHLSEDGRWQVHGPLGETIIEVRDGCIRVEDSPCPHKLCVQMGCRNRRGDIIACIPNKVIIHVQGGGAGQAVDGITR